jgi:hypothetical protein
MGQIMDQQAIEDILFEVLPGETESRPELARAAARAATLDEPMKLASSKEGDAFFDPETIDLLYKAALFVAAVIKGIKDGYDLGTSIVERIKKKDNRLADLPDDKAEELAKKTIERHREKSKGKK